MRIYQKQHLVVSKAVHFRQMLETSQLRYLLKVN